jgi:ABC-type branched-subunit amino acid transport system substrate-binding protein/glycosylphosphatidylinositol transamidase (GPIT) subunit GPI8
LVHKSGPVPSRHAGFFQATVIPINRKTLVYLAIIIGILAAGAWTGYTVIHANTPVRIGVLLPITGDVEFKEPLEWAKDTVNSQGGIAGRQLELVYKDKGAGNTTQLAQELLDDDSVRIVIGPDKSDDVYALAPAFIAKKKVLISPTATNGDILRAFGKNGYVWRTVQGDVAQVKVILTILKGRGATKVALLAENSSYGQTFYDWTGFFATEYGIEVPFIRQFDAGSPLLDTDVAAALETDPDYLVAIAWPDDAVTIKRAIDRSGSRTKLFLADAAAKPALISSLGAAAEGLEGTSPTASPSTGFTEAYGKKFGNRPADFAATAYDALLIAAFTEARQERAPFESLPDSVRQVVYGKGTVTGWDAGGVHTALSEIHNGTMPWITGASGGLEYDEMCGVDPIASYYANWRVENGTFRTVRILDSENSTVPDKTGHESIGESHASAGLMSASSALAGTWNAPAARTDFRAVIVGPSRGWNNYRHEADALSVYTLLRRNGVSDDNIILMLYDDIPSVPENPLKGNVHNVPKGPNIRDGAQVDYAGASVTAATFRDVMTGTKTASTPVVLAGNAGTDVFVYIASHGTPGRIVFGTGNSVLTAEEFAALTDSMGEERRYRQMAFFVDTCFGESVAANVTAPGILYLTGSDRNEPSLGAVYDMEIRQWLSDEFTAGVLSTIGADGTITFRDLYPATYARVTGSHVRLISTGNFDQDVPVVTYLSP